MVRAETCCRWRAAIQCCFSGGPAVGLTNHGEAMPAAVFDYEAIKKEIKGDDWYQPKKAEPPVQQEKGCEPPEVWRGFFGSGF